MTLGGIEAGGTKWVCAVGTGPDDVRDSVVFPTGRPDDTIPRALEFLTRHGPLDAVGIGSFGPLDLHPGSPTWGRITNTPKDGWSNTDLGSLVASELRVPVAFDTDVNAAALAEHRWGAAAGLDTFVYLTVGTGIGGGGMVGGALLHGLLHPEIGHMRIPHDRARDPFDGVCPYHGDCLEGLASGEAAKRRWPSVGPDAWDDDMLELEADYLALGLTNVICTLSPQRLIVGGGVMKQPTLLPRIRARVQELAAGYVDAPELRERVANFIVAPSLGDLAGVLGALELGRLAADATPAPA